MRPLRKTACLTACFTIFISFASRSQCSTQQSITYDTLITGTGNDAHVFTLSQFDPSIGTLLSAKINSTVSLNYGFTLKNVEAVLRDFSISVGRYDHYTSAALSSPYTNLLDTNIGSFLLSPGDSVAKAPYTILSGYSKNDSVTSDVVKFLGTSTVNFNYTPITYTSLTGSNVYYYNANANDTIHFSITYYYCSNAILANDLIAFSAEKMNGEIIKLSWKMANAQRGRNYEIQSGADGIIFTDIASIADGDSLNYEYDYTLSAREKKDIYFRLKITSSSGQVKYSEIKMIDLSDINAGKGAFLYPNPSNNYINIVFNEPGLKNWDASIYSPDGYLIQKNHFVDVLQGHIDFHKKFPAGVYFIRVESIESPKKYLLSFLVR